MEQTNDTWLAGFNAWRGQTPRAISNVFNTAYDPAPYIRHDFTCEEAERLYTYKLAVSAGFYSDQLA